MPVRYEVENTLEESVTIDGLGVLPPKSSTVVNYLQAENFRSMRGLNLTQVRLPEGVEIQISVSDDE